MASTKEKTPYSEQEMKTYRFLKRKTPAARNAYHDKVVSNPRDPVKVAAVKKVKRDYPHWFSK